MTNEASTDIQGVISDDVETNDTQHDIQELLAERERLLKHNEVLLSEKKARSEAARQAEAEKLRIEQEAAKKNGDFEALEKSYEQKFQEKQRELDELLKQRDSSTVEQTSLKIVSQLADTPTNQKLLQRFVKDYLKVADGKLRVLDENGELSAETPDDLANRIRNSGMYDSLLTGTRGSGSGGAGTGTKGVKSASDYSESERVELAKTNPDLFKQLFS